MLRRHRLRRPLLNLLQQFIVFAFEDGLQYFGFNLGSYLLGFNLVHWLLLRPPR